MAKKQSKTVKYGDRTFDENLLTEKEATRAVEKWQNVLGIRDWGVNVRLARARDMPLPNAQGVIDATNKKCMATIYLLDSADYNPDCVVPQDMEKTIVHELLHVLLKPLGISNDLDLEEEVLIEKLSSALIGVDRGHYN